MLPLFDLATELWLLELLFQPDPVKALEDYFAAVRRLRGGTHDGKLQQSDPDGQPDPRP